MTRGAKYTPTNAPIPMAYRELMMRFRSSDRCSKNVFWPPAASIRAAIELSSWLLLVMRGRGFRCCLWLAFDRGHRSRCHFRLLVSAVQSGDSFRGRGVHG